MKTLDTSAAGDLYSIAAIAFPPVILAVRIYIKIYINKLDAGLNRR